MVAGHGAAGHEGGRELGAPLLSRDEVADLLRLKKRQRNNLKALLTMPPAVTDALAADTPHFTATHALVLRQASRRGEAVNFSEWIGRVRDESLSVSQLRRRLRAADVSARETTTEAMTLFRADGTDGRRAVFRLLPIKIAVRRLRPVDRRQLLRDARALVTALEGGALEGGAMEAGS